MGQRNPLVTLAATGVGLLVVKMLTLTRADAPRWLLPVAGGAVFTGRVGLWLTSSLWFFTTFGIIR